MNHRKRFKSPAAQKLQEDFEKFKAGLGDWLSISNTSSTNHYPSNNKKRKFAADSTCNIRISTKNSNNNHDVSNNIDDKLRLGQVQTSKGKKKGKKKRKKLRLQQDISIAEQNNNLNELNKTRNNSALNTLKAMFPDADEEFLVSECQLLYNLEVFTRFIDNVMLLSGFYPKKKKKCSFEPDDDIAIISHTSIISSRNPSEGNVIEVIDLTDTNSNEKSKWVDEQLATLLKIFPNADPEYLKNECFKMDCERNALKEFVLSMINRNDIPTIDKCCNNFKMLELLKYYSENFDIEEFLKAIPDPWAYFSDVERKCIKYEEHNFFYLKSSCKKNYIADIQNVLRENNYNLYLSYHDLKSNDGWRRRWRSYKRRKVECSSQQPTAVGLHFLQEVAFIENEEKIKAFIENLKLGNHLNTI